MMEATDKTVRIDDIKRCYPDEWILLGNPEIDEISQSILSGIVLYHSPDKKEVCYLGKPLAAVYDKTALFFNRITPRSKRNVIASLFLSRRPMTYRFEKDPDGGIILVAVQLENRHTFRMVLDTAASRTTFDTTAFYMADYAIGHALETSAVETANAIVEVGIFEVDSLTALGRTVRHIPVQAYDFLAHGILSDYDGLLGLDFFENTVLCIDMIHQTIKVHSAR